MNTKVLAARFIRESKTTTLEKVFNSLLTDLVIPVSEEQLQDTQEVARFFLETVKREREEDLDVLKQRCQRFAEITNGL